MLSQIILYVCAVTQALSLRPCSSWFSTGKSDPLQVLSSWWSFFVRFHLPIASLFNPLAARAAKNGPSTGFYANLSYSSLICCHRNDEITELKVSKKHFQPPNRIERSNGALMSTPSWCSCVYEGKMKLVNIITIVRPNTAVNILPIVRL